MNLTEAQRAALNAVCAGSIVRGEFPTQTYESVFLAGLRMGRAEGREQAAKVAQAKFARVHTYASENSDRYLAMRDAGEAIAAAIRALPEEPT